jgi:hypothetical protein
MKSSTSATFRKGFTPPILTPTREWGSFVYRAEFSHPFSRQFLKILQILQSATGLLVHFEIIQ